MVLPDGQAVLRVEFTAPSPLGYPPRQAPYNGLLPAKVAGSAAWRASGRPGQGRARVSAAAARRNAVAAAGLSSTCQSWW